MSFIMRPIRFASTGHIIEGSGLWASTGTNHLTKTFASAAANRTTFTVESIFKLTALPTFSTLWGYDGGGYTYGTYCLIRSTGVMEVHFNGSSDGHVLVTPLFRDFGVYYHLVINVDTSQATATNRVRVYVDGTQLALTVGGNGWPSRNYATDFGQAGTVCYIGDRDSVSGTSPLRGYYGRVSVYENQRYEATEFGEVADDGSWQINDASGLTFGTNGFLIEGGTDMAAGTDSSGNSNNFSKTGTITSNTDSPTGDA